MQNLSKLIGAVSNCASPAVFMWHLRSDTTMDVYGSYNKNLVVITTNQNTRRKLYIFRNALIFSEKLVAEERIELPT